MEWRYEALLLLLLGDMVGMRTILRRFIGGHVRMMHWDLLAIRAQIESRVIGYHALIKAKFEAMRICVGTDRKMGKDEKERIKKKKHLCV